MTRCQAQACTHHLNNIPGFRSTTNYEGDDVDLEMEMVLMVVLVKMVLQVLPLRQGGVGDDDGGDFPSAAVAGQQDLPSPEVEDVMGFAT